MTPAKDEKWDSKSFLEATPAAADPATAELPYLPDMCTNFRHSGWAPARRRVDAAFAELSTISPRRMGAFRCCGADAYVEQAKYTSKYRGGCQPQFLMQWRVRSTKCHDRFCVPCSNDRAMRIRDSLLRHMYKMTELSLITITLQHSPDSLTDVLNRITKHFRALRLLPIWKKNIQGGVAIIETKLNADKTAWHTHFHIVAKAKFAPQKQLSEAWRKITGDSFIVDVRRVGALSGAVQYITKYITKAADSVITNSPKHLKEAIVAFTGRRLVSTFGTWRGLQLMERPDEEKTVDETTTWHTVGRLDEVIQWAGRGDPYAQRILHAISPRRLRDPTELRILPEPSG